MLGLIWKYLVRFLVHGAFRRAGTYVTPEDNGSDNGQVKDENGSIVCLPGILFRLCHNNIRLQVIGTGRVVLALPLSQDWFDLSWELQRSQEGSQWSQERLNRSWAHPKRSQEHLWSDCLPDLAMTSCGQGYGSLGPWLAEVLMLLRIFTGGHTRPHAAVDLLKRLHGSQSPISLTNQQDLVWQPFELRHSLLKGFAP